MIYLELLSWEMQEEMVTKKKKIKWRVSNYFQTELRIENQKEYKNTNYLKTRVLWRNLFLFFVHNLTAIFKKWNLLKNYIKSYNNGFYPAPLRVKFGKKNLENFRKIYHFLRLFVKLCKLFSEWKVIKG